MLELGIGATVLEAVRNGSFAVPDTRPERRHSIGWLDRRLALPRRRHTNNEDDAARVADTIGGRVEGLRPAVLDCEPQ